MTTHADLFAALRQSRRGLYRYDAPTEYLIRVHEITLTKPFAARAVMAATTFKMASAWIDFDILAVHLTGTQGVPAPQDPRVLQVAGFACLLADEFPPIGLHGCLSGLDRDHTRLILEAVAAHQGIHESRTAPDKEPQPITVTGRFDA